MAACSVDTVDKERPELVIPCNWSWIIVQCVRLQTNSRGHLTVFTFLAVSSEANENLQKLTTQFVKYFNINVGLNCCLLHCVFVVY